MELLLLLLWRCQVVAKTIYAATCSATLLRNLQYPCFLADFDSKYIITWKIKLFIQHLVLSQKCVQITEIRTAVDTCHMNQISRSLIIPKQTQKSLITLTSNFRINLLTSLAQSTLSILADEQCNMMQGFLSAAIRQMTWLPAQSTCWKFLPTRFTTCCTAVYCLPKRLV